MQLNDFVLEISVKDDDVNFDLSKKVGIMSEIVDVHSPLGKAIILFLLEQVHTKMASIINEDEFKLKFKTYTDTFEKES